MSHLSSENNSKISGTTPVVDAEKKLEESKNVLAANKCELLSSIERISSENSLSLNAKNDLIQVINTYTLKVEQYTHSLQKDNDSLCEKLKKKDAIIKRFIIEIKKLSNKLSLALKVKQEPKVKEEPKELVSTECQTDAIEEQHQHEESSSESEDEMEVATERKTKLDVRSICQLGDDFIRKNKLSKKLFAERVLKVDPRRFCDVLKRKPRWSLMTSPHCKKVMLELKKFLNQNDEIEKSKIDDTIERAKTLMKHTKLPIEVIARDFLNIDQNTFEFLIHNPNHEIPKNETFKKLVAINKWVFDYPYEFISLKKDISLKSLFRNLSEELEMNGVTFNEFAARILTSSMVHLRRVFDSPKYWSCYTKNMILHFNVIYNWLNDEQRWENFRISNKSVYYNNIGYRNGARCANISKPIVEMQDSSKRISLMLGLNDYQRKELEKAFERNIELNDELLASLSEKLELSFGTICEWFSSRNS